MIRIVNARSIEGKYFSFEIAGPYFRNVRKTSEMVHAPDGMAWDRLTSWDGYSAEASTNELVTLDAKGALIIPAAIDAHVHSRAPGLEHKENWHTLARAAYRGGVVAVGDMPNTIPPMMTREATLEKAKLARASGLDFRLFLGVGASNIGKVAEILGDPELPLCGLKVFYGRTTGDLMYDDLETLAKSLPDDGKKMIVFHSEDQCGVDRNHACHGADLERTDPSAFAIHSVIRSSETAHASTRTILHWAETSYKRPIHIAHVSTPLEVEMIAEARSKGVPVTCEVAPHHLLLSTKDYDHLGPLAKMNPPLRSEQEVADLRRLVGLGVVDIFATDHAPHLLSEKMTNVGKSPSGVPSVEFFYPLVFRVASLCDLDLSLAIAMSSSRPAELFGFEQRGKIEDGYRADFVWLSEKPFVVRNKDVLSRCGWSPYDGWELPRNVVGTWVDGRRVYAHREG